MSAGGQCITNVNDETLRAQILSTKRRVMLLAPGVSETVADALRKAMQRLGPEGVSVILDVDSEVCRLGYGTMAGLAVLQQAATATKSLIRHQPGVRIGVLVCDN